MKNKVRIQISLGFFVLSTIIWGVTMYIRNEREADFEYGFQAMDTWCTVWLYGAEDGCRRGVREVERIFREVEDAADIFVPDSELSQINRGAEEGEVFEVSQELADLFLISGRACDETGGVFDPSVLPLLEVYRNKDATAEEIAAAGELVGFHEAVKITGSRIEILKSGVKFDFGGVAKGYALDRAMEACGKIAGVAGGVINAGGNIGVFGNVEAVEVAFADPDAPDDDGGTFKLAPGYACASSGDYRRGKHIIDPEKGTAASVLHGVTVIARRGAEADYWSTALFIRPEMELPADICGILPDGSGGFTWRNGTGTEE